ncbi:hypothetical protein H8B02_30040 [Bradyrhizobium sp. Pear77]|nr:hypothetical protein [Bradyrhizobium altum]
MRAIENSVRGVLRGFGLKVGKITERTFADRIKELVAGHPGLELVAQALLEAHAVLRRDALELGVIDCALDALEDTAALSAFTEDCRP